MWTLTILGIVVRLYDVGTCGVALFEVCGPLFLHSRLHGGSRELLRLCRWTNGADSPRSPRLESRVHLGKTKAVRRREAVERAEISRQCRAWRIAGKT